MKKFFSVSVTVMAVAIVGFITNLIWEFLQIRLYEAYALGFSGYAPAVLQATLWDTWYVLMIYFGLVLVRQDWNWLKNIKMGDVIIIILLGITTATFVELRALHLGNWVYSPAMPLMPFLGVGISPLLQLVITSLITFWVSQKIKLQ